MPKIHVSSAVYEKLKETAAEQNRSVANMTETILTNVWSQQPANKKMRVESPDPVLKEPKKELLNIPGVELASAAKCKGTHFMSRKDCGKLDCPWKGEV